MPKKMESLVGKRFGRLVVVRFIQKKKDGHYLWLCRCDCGEVKGITRNRLMSSREPTRSCGCLQPEAASRNRKHGYSDHLIYKIWTSMKQRCLNPNNLNYPNYGGRGICVCDQWMEFSNFLEDMGNPPDRGRRGLMIERIDNDKGYEKKNCKWALIDEQSLNKRKTIRITFRGEFKPLLIWCEELGLNYGSALARFKAGRPPEEILEKPTPHQHFITYRGITKRMKEWAEELGIKLGTLSFRLKAGWSIEQALSKKVRGRG